MEKEIKLIILLYIILFAMLGVVLAIYNPATKEELEQAKEFCKSKDLNYLMQNKQEIICYGKDGSDKHSFKKLN